MPAPLPYAFEDRTGLLTASDFDEIYDRSYFHIAQSPQQREGTVLMIYNMHRRATRHRDLLPLQEEPSVIMEFGAKNALGVITFLQPPATLSVPMNRYLRKINLFGSSLSRKFMASDGQEYKWLYRSIQGQEWSCMTSNDYLVAHYILKPPDVRAYGVSGNILTIHEASAHLAIEFLASLTIMRHIKEYNL